MHGEALVQALVPVESVQVSNTKNNIQPNPVKIMIHAYVHGIRQMPTKERK